MQLAQYSVGRDGSGGGEDPRQTQVSSLASARRQQVVESLPWSAFESGIEVVSRQEHEHRVDESGECSNSLGESSSDGHMDSGHEDAEDADDHSAECGEEGPESPSAHELATPNTANTSASAAAVNDNDDDDQAKWLALLGLVPGAGHARN